MDEFATQFRCFTYLVIDYFPIITFVHFGDLIGIHFNYLGLNTGLFIPLQFGSDIVFPFFFPDTMSTMKGIQALKCNTMRGTPTQFIG